jgi:hypothetical protein
MFVHKPSRGNSISMLIDYECPDALRRNVPPTRNAISVIRSFTRIAAFPRRSSGRYTICLARNSHSGVDFVCGGRGRRANARRKCWLWIELIGFNFCESWKEHWSWPVSGRYGGSAVWFVKPSQRR